MWNEWKSADKGTDVQIDASQLQDTEQLRLSEERHRSVLGRLVLPMLSALPPSSFKD